MYLKKTIDLNIRSKTNTTNILLENSGKKFCRKGSLEKNN